MEGVSRTVYCSLQGYDVIAMQDRAVLGCSGLFWVRSGSIPDPSRIPLVLAWRGLGESGQ